MFGYVFMRMLESQPSRYDRGISLLSFGHIGRVRERIVKDLIQSRSRVLDIGCGTGALALLAASKGARVLAFDPNPRMIDEAERKLARRRLDEPGQPPGSIELRTMGIGRMEELSAGSFDLAAAVLVLSELSPEERSFALKQACRLLKVNGKLVVADEVPPERAWRRMLYRIARVPLLVLAYVLTQTTTRGVEAMAEQVESAGFRIETSDRLKMGSFLYLVASRTA